MDFNIFKCCGGNKAETVCIVISCKSEKGALLCSSQQCSCKNIHKQCFMTFPLHNLIKALNEKGKTYLPVLNQLLQFYEIMIKTLTIEKQSLLHIIEDCPMTLERDSKDLYQKLKSGELVTPEQVGKVVQMIINSPKIDIQNKLKSCQQQSTNMMGKFEQIIKGMKKYFLIGYEINYQHYEEKPFSSQIVKPDRQKIQQKLQLTYLIKSLKDFGYVQSKILQHYRLCYFKPLLTLRKKYYQCFKFKIKQITPSRSITLGLSKYQQNNIVKIDDINHGCYMISSKGTKFINNQKNQNSSLTFSVNEIIRVDYDPLNKRVVFMKNKQTQIIKINPEQSNGLSLCIGIQYPKDEVQFLGECDQYDM